MKRTVFLLTIVRRTKWRGSHPPVVADTTTVRTWLHHPGANSKASPSSGSLFPHSSKMYLLLASSCCGVANLVFGRGGRVFGKVYSFEDYKESRGQGLEGASDRLQ